MISLQHGDEIQIFVPEGLENEMIFSFIDNILFPGCGMRIIHPSSAFSDYSTEQIKDFFSSLCSVEVPFIFKANDCFILGQYDIGGFPVFLPDALKQDNLAFFDNRIVVKKIDKKAAVLTFSPYRFPEKVVGFFGNMPIDTVTCYV